MKFAGLNVDLHTIARFKLKTLENEGAVSHSMRVLRGPSVYSNGSNS